MTLVAFGFPSSSPTKPLLKGKPNRIGPEKMVANAAVG
jgi:hypothetical protein